MVFATGVFYAEPCYDLQECAFTDIFNAGYFVMVTYGLMIDASPTACRCD